MKHHAQNPRLLSKTVHQNPRTLVTWRVTYNADNKRAQRARLLSSPTAILRLVRGLTSARARSGIPRRSGNCYRPVLFSNDTAAVSMSYDYMGRRFEYKETVTGSLTRHERYLYRGYLQISTLDMLNSASVKHTIAWDASEPVATRPLALQVGANAYYYSFDQVKNVTELFDSTGALAATYDYSPFGQLTSFQITQSGNNAITQFSNPLTFSSEVFDSTLGLQYYNYRHLNTIDGRWVNRDPIGERGGANVYYVSMNALINKIDFLGRKYTLDIPIIETYLDDVKVVEDSNGYLTLGQTTFLMPTTIMRVINNDCKKEKDKYGEFWDFQGIITVTYFVAPEDPIRQEVERHEHKHVVDARIYYNTIKDNRMKGECLCMECYNATARFYYATHKAASAKYLYDSDVYDSHNGIGGKGIDPRAFYRLKSRITDVLTTGQDAAKAYQRMQKACKSK